MSTALKAATVYVARKWNPIPLPFKAKKPTGNEWQKRVIGEADLPQCFNGKQQNVGVVLGPTSNGLTDIDLDCREAVELASHTLPKTDAIFGRASAPASHWLYRTTLASKSEDENATFQLRDPTNKAMLLEVRVGGFKGAQTVFPGSVHESGEEIRWDETGDEAEVDGNDLLKRARLLASICLFARYWPGSKARHDAALSVGGFLARAGLEVPTIKYLAEAIARAAGDGDPRNRRDTAEDAAQAFHSGKHARGYPEVKKAFGEEVARQIAEWLDYEGSIGGDEAEVNAEPTEPIEPVDLWGSFEPPTLPRGLLPKLIEDYALAQGETMGVDPGGVAMAALAVCAAAIPDDTKLAMKRHSNEWMESARLWVGMVGLPSVKKSPIISAVAWPLVRLDAILLREYLSEMQRWEQLDKAERAKVPKPLQKRHRLEDTTIEAAQEALAGSPDGLLLMQDELSGFFGAIDKYGGRGAAKDRSFWLTSYNGGQYAVSRITRGVGLIPNLSVSLLGGIQPDVIRRVSSEFYDDGLLQRMLLIMMRPGGVGKDVAMPNVSRNYIQLVEKLTTLRRYGVLHFDNSAQDLRNKLEAWHVELMNIEAINKKLAAHIGKYDGLFGRLCVAFHCIEHVDDIDDDIPELVTGDTAERVAEVHATSSCCPMPSRSIRACLDSPMTTSDWPASPDISWRVRRRASPIATSSVGIGACGG